MTPYVKIGADGVLHSNSPRSEMGQGMLTTLPAMVAEELDVGLDQVTIKHAPVGYAYYNAAVLEEVLSYASTDQGTMAETMRGVIAVSAKFLANQGTGRSSSIRDGYDKLRLADAAARAVLIEATAQKLGIAGDRLKTERGMVISPNGNQIPYTALAGLAAGIEPPADPPLKDPAD